MVTLSSTAEYIWLFVIAGISEAACELLRAERSLTSSGESETSRWSRVP
jgi:hypothetical protein